jgi:hypothetical protein
LRSIFVPCGERLELLAPSRFVSLLVVVGEELVTRKQRRRKEIEREREGKKKERRGSKPTPIY